jgi:Icc-related predicted phosphoesterase
MGLKILAFTDFHGNQEAYRAAKELIMNEKPDFVIVAGDIINYDANRAKELLSDLASAGRLVYFVPGNMDSEELGGWGGSENVHALHGRCERRKEVSLIGLGGSPRGPFRTVFEYSEEEGAALLQAAVRHYRGGHLILVSHCPPKNTKVDRISSGEHVGSSSVRKLVENKRPVLVVSGHVHEARGTDTIGSTTLLNTGPAQRGHCALITIGETVRVQFSKLF